MQVVTRSNSDASGECWDENYEVGGRNRKAHSNERAFAHALAKGQQSVPNGANGVSRSPAAARKEEGPAKPKPNGVGQSSTRFVERPDTPPADYDYGAEGGKGQRTIKC